MKLGTITNHNTVFNPPLHGQAHEESHRQHEPRSDPSGSSISPYSEGSYRGTDEGRRSLRSNHSIVAVLKSLTHENPKAKPLVPNRFWWSVPPELLDSEWLRGRHHGCGTLAFVPLWVLSPRSTGDHPTPPRVSPPCRGYASDVLRVRRSSWPYRV